jgi:hypothetical protein
VRARSRSGANASRTIHSHGLEDGLDRPVLGIVEPAAAVAADVAHVEDLRVPSGLHREIEQVFGVADVLLGIEQAGQVEQAVGRLAAQRRPARDQRLVQAVELVRAGVRLREPLPLGKRGLDQRGGGVGVVLEHARRAGAVPGEVEAAEQCGLAQVPGAFDQRPHRVGDRERGRIAGTHRVGDHLQAHAVHLDAGLVQTLDLRGVEVVGGVLAPVAEHAGVRRLGIAALVDRVVVETDLLQPGGPVDAGELAQSAHGRGRVGRGRR